MEDIFQCFKSELNRDQDDYQTGKLAAYLKANPTGIKIRDLASLNEIVAYFIDNFEDVTAGSLKLVVEFFDAASLGFTKERSFDDKQNSQSIIGLLNLVAAITDRTTRVFETSGQYYKAEKIRALLEICYFAISFVYNFLTDKISLVNANNGLGPLKLKGRVSYFETKRFKNIRECENEALRNNKLVELEHQSTDESERAKSGRSSCPDVNFRLYEQSELPITFIDFLQKNSSTLKELCVLILEIKQVTSVNESLASKMISLGFLKDLAYIIYDNRHTFREYMVKLSFEILWNILELMEKEATASIMTEDVLLIFKEMFCLTLSNGYKMEDKVLRNELLIMINNLLDSERLAETVLDVDDRIDFETLYKLDWKSERFQHLSLLEILLFMCTHDEILMEDSNAFSKNTLLKRKFFDLSNEDLQLKKLSINCLSLLVMHSKNIQLLDPIIHSKFLNILLMYINPDKMNKNPAVTRFSQPQLKELQFESLRALEQIAIKCPERLIKENIFEILLQFIDKLKGDIRIMHALNIIVKLLAIGSTFIKTKFGESGAIDVLTDLLNSNETLVGLGDDDLIKIRTCTFNAIAEACNHNNAFNQNLIAQKGFIEIMVLYLKNSKIHMSEKNVLLTMSFFNALWCCILGNPKNEEIFFESDGFYSLMEFLETALSIHRKQALSLLSGLMENRKSFRYFEEWNSSISSINSTQLLLRIYREEDERFSVEYKDGVLIDKARPLNPVLQKSENSIEIRKGYSKKAFSKLVTALRATMNNSDDELENEKRSGNICIDSILIKFLKSKTTLLDLRRIVYSILYRIGFDRNQISKTESQMMAVVQNYPHLRIGEIWQDIKLHCDRNKIPVTKEDQFFIETNILEFQRVVDECTKLQENTARETRKVQEEELNKFYDLLRNQKKYVH
jgi:hypothetical protein